MAINKLPEFAKDGQKNTDDLVLTDGFPVLKKPARQWFNWLFNTLTTKINEIVDADFMPKSDVVDNLTTDDPLKPVSAKQAKVLQETKLGKSENLSDVADVATARTNLGIPELFEDFGLSLQPYSMASGELIANLPKKSFLVYNRGGAPLPSDSPTSSGIKGITIGYYQWNTQLAFGAYTNEMYIRARTTTDGAYRSWSKVRSEANTTVDSNGFIKNASPIVELNADHTNLNDEAKQQSITFEKLGVGDYLIKGSSGLSNDGWYIEQPKDANGNIYHAVVHEQLESGDISIRTYECKLNEIGQTIADLEKPIDIKENRFITLRLNELPQDVTAPQNPNVVDNEGNPAPSKYHYLENGTWKITTEDELVLADERYAAYQASLRPLTRRQFKLALLENGLLDQIENSISAIEDSNMRARIQIEYTEATEFHRTSDSVMYMCQLLNLTDDQVDQMWESALTL